MALLLRRGVTLNFCPTFLLVLKIHNSFVLKTAKLYSVSLPPPPITTSKQCNNCIFQTFRVLEMAIVYLCGSEKYSYPTQRGGCVFCVGRRGGGRAKDPQNSRGQERWTVDLYSICPLIQYRFKYLSTGS